MRHIPILLAMLLGLEAAQAATFSRGRSIPVGPNPCAIAVQDLNDDGLPDIVTADRGELMDPREEVPANDELSLLIAQEPLRYVRRTPALKTGFGPYDVALANIDALKWPDIIVASFHSGRINHISLFLNLKNENNIWKPLHFAVPEEQLGYEAQTDSDGMPLFTEPGLTALAVRDLNGDGLRDVLATGWASDVLVFLPGHAETHFGPPTLIDAPGGPRQLALEDFDGDGMLDLATVMYRTGEVALWKGSGGGAFVEVGRFPTRGQLPSTVDIADMNADGISDIVVSHRYTQDSIVIFYGDGDFNFSVSQEILLGEARQILESGIRDVALADFSGNGRFDIAAACGGSGEVVVLLNTSSDSARRQQYTRETYTWSDGRAFALAAADLNQDGEIDLAVALWDSNEVALLVND